MPRLFLTIDTELMPLLSVLKGQNRKDAFPTLSGAEEGGGPAAGPRLRPPGAQAHSRPPSKKLWP